MYRFLMMICIPFGLFSQVLAPVEGTISNFEGVPSQNEKIIFKGVKLGKKVVCYSDGKGKFNAELPDGDKYLIQIESYQEEKEYSSIEIPKAPEGAVFQPISVQIKFEHPKSFTLKNIQFETGKSNLTPHTKSNLKQLSAYLKRKKTLKIKLIGHTDNVGDAQANLKLSKQRAESVKKYLVSLGCSSSFIFCEGKGGAMPVSDNNSAKGRAKNRRTEIQVL